MNSVSVNTITEESWGTSLYPEPRVRDDLGYLWTIHDQHSLLCRVDEDGQDQYAVFARLANSRRGHVLPIVPDTDEYEAYLDAIALPAEPASLPEWLDHEAASYDAMGCPHAAGLAERLRELAGDARFLRATTWAELDAHGEVMLSNT